MPALCIDVDGTLLRTDLLFESVLCLGKQKPWLLVCLPFWLLRGKAYLKRRLSDYASGLSPSLPLHGDLVQFLTKESDNGRRLVLCSGSDEYLVQKVAVQLNLPVEVMASNGRINLTGENKAKALVDRFGAGGFDYVGNSSTDLPVWSEARHAIVVNAPERVRKAAEKNGNVSLVMPRNGHPLLAFIRAIRAYQWVKNVLVFVPLITSHTLLEPARLLNSIILFFALSFCASSVYLVNDLADIDADRKHPSKRKRPFASGDLPIWSGIVLAPALFILGIMLSLLLPVPATVMLFCYLTLATIYTFWLKKKLLADVVTLGMLYTVRIVAGGAATGVLVSPWLLAFSLFLFLSFAFSKRVAEMIRLSATTEQGVAGRAYFVADTSTLAMLGSCSGFLACLVLTLYINSDVVRDLYVYPAWLWLLLPLLLYWLGRIWIVTMRGRMRDDPILYVFKDFRTYAALLAAAIILWLATNSSFGIPGIMQ